MKFDEVIADLNKLVGVKIGSIKNGADITLTEVNVHENRIELLDASGSRCSRSLSELRRVWDALCRHKAIHVDSVLAGSGSRRNQPETILANLPYVEWLIHEGKKHISLVEKPTHTPGTLKQMDSLATQELRTAMQKKTQLIPTAVIIVEDPRPLSNCIEGISGLAPTAKAVGAYAHNLADREILVVNHSSLAQPLLSGMYVVITGKTPPLGSKVVMVADAEYYLVVRDGIRILVHVL